MKKKLLIFLTFVCLVEVGADVFLLKAYSTKVSQLKKRQAANQNELQESAVLSAQTGEKNAIEVIMYLPAKNLKFSSAKQEPEFIKEAFLVAGKTPSPSLEPKTRFSQDEDILLVLFASKPTKNVSLGIKNSETGVPFGIGMILNLESGAGFLPLGNNFPKGKYQAILGTYNSQLTLPFSVN